MLLWPRLYSGQLVWSSYFGGLDEEIGNGCAVDLSGSVYICGSTTSPVGIASNSAQQSNYGGNTDAFFAKFSSTGVLDWSTYYGGPEEDIAYDVATNRTAVYLCGGTNSLSGISHGGVHQYTYWGGVKDAFLIQFDGNGFRQWGSYFGGQAEEEAYSCETDARGNIYLGGFTSLAFHISNPTAHQGNLRGSYDGFLCKFDAIGNVIWSTYLGGKRYDFGTAVCVDHLYNVYLGGYTFSDSSIASPGSYQPSKSSKYDAFLTKFDSTGVQDWSTYYVGPSYEYGNAAATDPNGAVYLAGHTFQSGFI